ncbi:ABC transporter ATP-binding protein [Facklamia sp. DSM 111019]|nr:ABC transporter ATP-binding protein [Facklamia lactis]MBG9980404.1 ABC transporter ATP-binding protein [Facklamia lactis]
MMINAIEINNLTKNYPNFSLGPINLSVPKGSMVGYIGENGAGKSTTLKAILGLVSPDSGDIKVFDQQIDPKIMNKIGVVFDELHISGEMEVKEVGIFCRLSYDSWDDEQFSTFMEMFRLPLDQKVKTLSRGMKMKLSLSIALSHQAELLILDEATSGLDPVIRDEILDILLDFIQDENHTVLISSHILSDLEKAADYIAFLHNGQILFMEEKDQLVENYGLCSLDKDKLETIDPKAIIGRRDHAFGVELLVKRDLVPDGINLEKPSIEDIMVYIIKGDKNASATL